MRTSAFPVFDDPDFSGFLIVTVEITPGVFRLRRVPKANFTGSTGSPGAAGSQGPAGEVGPQGPAGSSATYGVVPYAVVVEIDFDGDGLQEIQLTGDLELTTANLAAGTSVAVILVADGAGPWNLIFPGWKFLNSSGVPTSIAANKTAVLSLTARDATDAQVIAVYVEEP